MAAGSDTKFQPAYGNDEAVAAHLRSVLLMQQGSSPSMTNYWDLSFQNGYGDYFVDPTVPPHLVARATMSVEWRLHGALIGPAASKVHEMSLTASTGIQFPTLDHQLAHFKANGGFSGDVTLVGLLEGIEHCVAMIRNHTPLTVVFDLPEGTRLEYLNPNREDIANILSVSGVEMGVVGNGRYLALTTKDKIGCSDVAGAVKMLDGLLGPAGSDHLLNSARTEIIVSNAMWNLLSTEIPCVESFANVEITTHVTEPDDFAEVHGDRPWHADAFEPHGNHADAAAVVPDVDGGHGSATADDEAAAETKDAQAAAGGDDPFGLVELPLDHAELGRDEVVIRIRGEASAVLLARGLLLGALPVVLELSVPPDFQFDASHLPDVSSGAVGSSVTPPHFNRVGKTLGICVKERDLDVLLSLGAQVQDTAWVDYYAAQGVFAVGFGQPPPSLIPYGAAVFPTPAADSFPTDGRRRHHHRGPYHDYHQEPPSRGAAYQRRGRGRRRGGGRFQHQQQPQHYDRRDNRRELSWSSDDAPPPGLVITPVFKPGELVAPAGFPTAAPADAFGGAPAIPTHPERQKMFAYLEQQGAARRKPHGRIQDGDRATGKDGEHEENEPRPHSWADQVAAIVDEDDDDDEDDGAALGSSYAGQRRHRANTRRGGTAARAGHGSSPPPPPRRFSIEDEHMFPPMPTPAAGRGGGGGGGTRGGRHHGACTYMVTTEVAEYEHVEGGIGGGQPGEKTGSRVLLAWQNMTGAVTFAAGPGTVTGRRPSPAPTPTAIVAVTAAAMSSGHHPDFASVAAAAQHSQAYTSFYAHGGPGFGVGVRRGGGGGGGGAVGADRFGDENERRRRHVTVRGGGDGGRGRDEMEHDGDDRDDEDDGHDDGGGAAGAGESEEDVKARLASEIRDTIFFSRTSHWSERTSRGVGRRGSRSFSVRSYTTRYEQDHFGQHQDHQAGGRFGRPMFRGGRGGGVGGSGYFHGDGRGGGGGGRSFPTGRNEGVGGGRFVGPGGDNPRQVPEAAPAPPKATPPPPAPPQAARAGSGVATVIPPQPAAQAPPMRTTGKTTSCMKPPKRGPAAGATPAVRGGRGGARQPPKPLGGRK